MTSLRLITLVACIVVNSTSGSPGGSGGSTSGGSGGAGGSGAGGSPSGSGTWTLGGSSGPTTSGSSSSTNGESTGSTNESESSPYGMRGGLRGTDQITGYYLYSQIPVTRLLLYRYRGGNLGGIMASSGHWDLFGRGIQGGRRLRSLYDFYRPYGPTEYGGIISQSGHSGDYRNRGLFSGQGSQTSHYRFEQHSPLLQQGGLPQRGIYEAYSGHNAFIGGHNYYRVPFGGLYGFRGVGLLAQPLIQGIFHQSYDPFSGFRSFGSHTNQYLHMPQYLRSNIVSPQ